MKINTLISIVLFALVSPLSLLAQQGNYRNISTEDKSEFFYNKFMSINVIQTVQKQTGASDQEIQNFNAYYNDTLSSDLDKCTVMGVNDPNMSDADFKIYSNGIINKYISLYHNFQEFEKNYPNTVSEYVHRYHTPTLPTCNTTPCDNLGFENGDLSGWTGGYLTNNSTSTAFSYSAVTYTGVLGAVTVADNDPTVTGQHPKATNMLKIMSGTGTDPLTGVSVVCPGAGSYSCRIGDTTVPGSQIAVLTNTFIVTNTNCDFTYYYAVVIENVSSHTHYDLPFFNLTMFDQNGDTIPFCGNYQVVANQAQGQGFDSVSNSGTEVYYSQWKSAFVPLKKYVGQCVSIYVEVSDCGPGGHFGYAYFDATCAPLQILSSAPYVCGSPITLTAPTASGYQWSGPCIVGSSTAQTITVGCAGKYQVILSSVIGATCADTLDTIIAGGAGVSPVPNFTADTACLGSATSFTNTTTGGNPATNVYSWNFGNGGNVTADSSHATNPTYTYPAVGTYTVTLQALNGSCGGDTTHTVVVVSPPTPAFSANTVCFNTPTAFTNNSTPATGPFSWSFGDGGTSTTASPTHTYKACGTYTVTLKAGAKGCIDSVKNVIIVNPNPAPNFVSDTVCIGYTTTFTDKSTIACAGTVTGWSWNFGDASGTSTSQNPTYTYGTTGKFSVVLTATSDSGCTSAITLPVVVSPNPVAAFTPTPVCLGQISQFTDQSSGVPTKWSWNFGDGVGSSTKQNPTYIYTAAGTYTVKLIVSSGAGCIDSTTESITIYPLPTSGFTATTVCQGTATAFTDTSHGGNSWLWRFGDPAKGTSTLENPTYIYAKAGTYKVTEIVTTLNGCKDSITIPIIVNPNPTGVFTVPPVCLGTVSVFTLTTTNMVGGTYLWTFGDAAAGTSTVQNPTYTYATTGSFNVKVVLTSDSGCVGDTTGIAIVNPIPVANFIAPPVCQDQAMQFTSTSTVSSGTISTYSWNFGDGSALSTLQNPTHQFKMCGTYSVELTVTSVADCSHDTTITVTINPVPVPKFTATTVCLGLTTTFTDASTIACGDSIVSWNWSFGDASSSTLENPTHTYGNAGIYPVTLLVKSSNGCDSSFTISVTVYPLPVPSFTNNSPCLGNPTNFVNTSTVAGGITTPVLWSFGDPGNTTSTQANPSFTYLAAGTYTVQLIVTSNFGCIDSTTKTVTVNPNPVPLFVSDTVGCTPLCVKDSDESSVAAPGSINSWLWNFGDGSYDSASMLPNPSHCYTKPGTYSVTLTVTTTNGCSESLTRPNYITAWPVPTANFIASPNPTVLINNPTVAFIDHSSGNPVSWSWFNFGDGKDSVAVTENTTHTYTDTGTFVVYLAIRNKFGCVDTAEVPVVVQPVWTFYVPNAFTPNGDGLNDGFIGKGVGILSYEMWIFDRWGMQLYHCTDITKPWNGRVENSTVECQEDTYVWLIDITDVFHQQHRYVGKVTLIK